MQLPCIRINQSDPPPKFDFLKQLNFLGEFKTEVDKARVRFNLGIPDSYSFNWGNIGGTIDNQRDLKTKFDLYYNLLGIERNRIDDILEQIDILNSITTRLSNVIEGSDSISQMSTDIEDFKQRLTRAETNINQNTALILQLMNGTITPGGGGGGGSYDLSGYATENWVINYISSTLSSTLSGYVSTNAFNELANRVNSLTGRTLTRIELSQSSLSATVGDDPKLITVTAYYSDNTTSDITETVETVNSSNDSFARWTNHKVQIVGAGTATLTFTYGGFSATLTVTVTSSSPGLELTYYIGYATAQNLLDGNVVGNSLFAITTSNNTIELTGEGIKKYQGCDLGEGELLQGTKLFFCCLDTKNLSEWHEISQGEDEAMIFQTYAQGISLGNEHYNVYLLSPRTYDNLTYIFKIN